MALSILDGNQTATTLSTILSSGQHITAHTVVSLGSQAKTDILSAVSNGIAISGTVTANGGDFTQSILDALDNYGANYNNSLPVAFSQPISSIIEAGTARIGVVTIGGGTVTIGAGTAQIGSVTVGNSITVGSLPVLLSTTTIGGTARLNVTLSSATTSGSTAPSYANLYGGTDGTNLRAISVDTSGRTVVTGSVSIATLSALVAGTAQIGSVTASISNSVVTFYPLQGTTVANSNFTSLTSSTSLVAAVANRESLTVFNEGAGNLHISPGATCTTISYQVRLSSGDYWECPAGQLSLAHTAVFATAGTARVTQVS
jgi:hypothetical protein